MCNQKPINWIKRRKRVFFFCFNYILVRDFSVAGIFVAEPNVNRWLQYPGFSFIVLDVPLNIQYRNVRLTIFQKFFRVRSISFNRQQLHRQAKRWILFDIIHNNFNGLRGWIIIHFIYEHLKNGFLSNRNETSSMRYFVSISIFVVDHFVKNHFCEISRWINNILSAEKMHYLQTLIFWELCPEQKWK